MNRVYSNRSCSREAGESMRRIENWTELRRAKDELIASLAVEIEWLKSADRLLTGKHHARFKALDTHKQAEIFGRGGTVFTNAERKSALGTESRRCRIGQRPASSKSGKEIEGGRGTSTKSQSTAKGSKNHNVKGGKKPLRPDSV